MVLSNGSQVTITDFLGRSHRFEVVRSLGDGYLADVYLMENLLDRSPVVVKVLKERHAGIDSKTADFLREADILQQLAHRPEVVQLRSPSKGDIALNAHTRLPCILMEYVDSSYLSLPALAERGIEEITALEICRQFLSLLEHIHSRYIAYSDLKAEHIYWNGTQIKVIDWNVVRDLSDADEAAIQEAITKELMDFGQVMYTLFTGQTTPLWVEGPAITTLVSESPSNKHLDFGDTTLSLGTRLLLERLLDDAHPRPFTSAAALERAVTQQKLRLTQMEAERETLTRAAVSKGLAAIEAGDYEDAVHYFENAVHLSPGLITQSQLLTARLRCQESLPEPAKDQLESQLALFRMALQEGDLTAAQEAVQACLAIYPDHPGLQILHTITVHLAENVVQAQQAFASADYATAREQFLAASQLAPTAQFLRERVEMATMLQVHLEEGQQALAAGQYAKAVAAFETLLDHTPHAEVVQQSWLEAQLGQATHALAHSAYDEAERAFHAILERWPDHEQATTGLNAVAAGRQRLQEVERWLSKARSAFRNDDFERALQATQMALELEPQHAGARQLLADIQEAQRLQRARHVRRWLEKGRHLMAEGQYVEAIQYFEQAAALDPEGEAGTLRARAEAAQARTERFQALLHKAYAAFQGEDYDAAVQYFEEAVDLAPGEMDARRGLTLARQRQAKMKVHEAQNLLARGRAALSAGRYEEALQHFERASEMDSNAEIAEYIEKTFQIRDLVHNAEAAVKRGNFQEAVMHLNRALEIEPLPGLEQQMAPILARAQQARQEQVATLIERAKEQMDHHPRRAVAWLQQAYELAPDNAEVAELLNRANEQLKRWQARLHHLLDTGKAAIQAGDDKTAEQAFIEALKLDPEHMEAQAGHFQAQQLHQYLETARNAASLKEYHEVVAALNKALQIAPDSIELREQLEQARCDALLQKAYQAAEAGDHGEALALIDQASAIKAEYTAHHDLTQEIQACIEAEREAQEMAQHQALLEEVRALMTQAETHLNNRDYESAMEAIDAALALTPDNAQLNRWRREIAQQKALHDRAQLLLHQARRFEMSNRHAEAAEAYEIAARLTSDPGLEAEVRARADKARRNQRRQRWQHLLRRLAGFQDSSIAKE